jgi:hypothetical protein
VQTELEAKTAKLEKVFTAKVGGLVGRREKGREKIRPWAWIEEASWI